MLEHEFDCKWDIYLAILKQHAFIFLLHSAQTSLILNLFSEMFEIWNRNGPYISLAFYITDERGKYDPYFLMVC